MYSKATWKDVIYAYGVDIILPSSYCEVGNQLPRLEDEAKHSSLLVKFELLTLPVLRINWTKPHTIEAMIETEV